MAKSLSLCALTQGLLSVVAVASTLLWATQGFAAQITGQLDITGPDAFTDTSITFNGPGDIPSPTVATGDFSALGSCMNCATMNDFDTGTPTPFQVYSVTITA